jgi:hypothetical protein
MPHVINIPKVGFSLRNRSILLLYKFALLFAAAEKWDETPRNVRKHLAKQLVYRNHIRAFKLEIIFWPNRKSAGLPASWAG